MSYEIKISDEFNDGKGASLKRGLLRELIIRLSEEEQMKEIDNTAVLSYPYEKYGEHVLAFQFEGDGMNIQFCNLSKDFSDGLYAGYLETKFFVGYLGDRIALAFNYFKGKTNEEIKKIAGGGMDGV